VTWSSILGYEQIFSTERVLSLLQSGITLVLSFVVARLVARGIEIPFPHRSPYSGSETGPFPVRLVEIGEDGQS